MDKLLSYLAARIELKVCDERRACEKHICNKQQKKAPEKTRIAMRSNGPQKQVLLSRLTAESSDEEHR